MTFTIQTSTLRQTLSAIMGIVPNRPIVAILENILVQVSPGRISLTASNTEQTVTMNAQAETSDEGSFLINAKDIKRIVGACSFPSVTVECDNGTANIGCGFSDYKITALPAVEYPVQSIRQEPLAVLSVPSNDLRLALSKVAHAIEENALMPQLNGAHLEIKEGTLTTVATDTRILAKSVVSTEGITSEASLTLPTSVLPMIQGSFLSEPTVKMSVCQGGCEFECGENRLVTVLVNGRYPDYNRVIPQTPPHYAEFARKDLMSALNAVGALSTPVNSTEMLFSGGKCKISINDKDFNKSAKSECPCESNIEEIDIFFNLKYLESALKSTETERVRVYLIDPTRPAIIVGVGDEGSLNLVMPMQGK